MLLRIKLRLMIIDYLMCLHENKQIVTSPHWNTLIRSRRLYHWAIKRNLSSFDDKRHLVNG